MRKILFLIGIYLALLIVPASYAETLDCSANPEFEDRNHACYTTCSELEVLDRVPGCFSKGLVAPDQDKVFDQINESDFRTQVLTIVNYFLGFLGLLAVLVIIYSGIKLIAQGEDGAEEAKSHILYAAIGIIIILLSFPFVNWVLDSGSFGGSSGGQGGTNNNGSDQEVVEEFESGNEDNNSDTITSPTDDAGADTPINSAEDDLKALLDKIGKLDARIAAILKEINNPSLSDDKLEDILNSLSDQAGMQDIIDKLKSSDLQINDILANTALKTDIQDILDRLESVGYAGLTEIEKERLKNAITQAYDDKIASKVIEAMQNGATTITNEDFFKNYQLLSEAQKRALEEALLAKYGQDTVDKILNYLKNGSRLSPEYQKEIKDAMDAQNYPNYISKDIIEKINRGQTLSQKDKDRIETALKYGLMIQRLETELSILYKSMPKTSVNVAAYNDVLTVLSEVKSDPSNERKILLLKTQLNNLLNLIAKTPKVSARIRALPARGSAPLIVSFDGSDSLDPNNITIPSANYHWSYYDTTGTNREIGTSPIVEHLFTEPGLYVVQLRVETSVQENGFKTAMDGVAKVRVKVMPQNSTINILVNGKKAESIRKVHIDDAKNGITFDASQTQARIGRKITDFRWVFGDGSEDSTENGAPITHRYDEVGEYQVRLEVRDNTGDISTKSIKLIVEHLSADITALPEEGRVRSSFSFSANDSKSSDSLIQKYYWEIRDKEGEIIKSSENEKLDFTPSTAGKYSIKLVIEDSEGNQSFDIFELPVKSLSPSANFIYQSKSFSEPSKIQFDASSSSDPDQEQLLYSWDFDGDDIFEIEKAESPNQNYQYDKVGSYNVKLLVEDPHGEKNEVTKIVKIRSILDVDFQTSATAVQKGQEVFFKPISPLARNFYWSFGDSSNLSSDESEVSHIYDRAGSYSVSLTVFDENDNENKVSKRIYVGDGESPVAAFEVEIDGKRLFPEENLCGGDVGLKVSRMDTVKFIASSSINIDGSGHLLDYTWNFGDGEFGNTKVSSHRYSEVTPEDKCFEVNLTVKDRVSKKESQTQSLYIMVENLKPTLRRLIVNESNDDDDKITPYTVSLRAQDAHDPDGNIKNYRWWYRRKNEDSSVKKGVVQTQMPFSNLVIVSDGISGLENEYIFFVEMTDNEGNITVSDEVIGDSTSLIVKNGNVSAPIVDFFADKNQVYSGDTISFFAEVKDAQGQSLEKVNYEWDFDGDGIFDDVSSGAQVSRRFDAPGEYSVRLRVKNKGLSTSKRKTVYVEKITRYPLAAFTYQIRGGSIFADASTSRYDPSLTDSKLRFEWDFDKFYDADGDGDNNNDKESVDIRPRYSYSKPGTYFVTLRVIDSLGNVDTVSRKIFIKEASLEDDLQELASGGKRSPQISSKNTPITTLDLSIDKKEIIIGELVIIQAKVQNADGSDYSDYIEFSVEDGEAYFDNDYVKAISGNAETAIYPTQPGRIVINVVAKNTFHETMEEKIEFHVKEKISSSLADPGLSDEQININELRQEN